MRVKYEFAVREIAGDYVLVPLGMAALEFAGMITTNEVGAFLWNLMQNEVELETLVKEVMNAFEIDETTARQDVVEFVEQVRQLGILEE